LNDSVVSFGGDNAAMKKHVNSISRPIINVSRK
jgi:hypothetical protein